MVDNADSADRPTPGTFQGRDGIRKLEFGKDLAFQLELTRRVDEYFTTSGRPRRDCRQIYLKTFLILASFAIVYGLLVFAAGKWWQGLLLTSLLALITAGIGFNIQHEGGHQAYSRRPWVNATMAFALDFIGSSSYRWHWKHSVIHHRYVNIAGMDGDMYMGPLGRLAPQQTRRWYHRWQHLYLWPIYAMLAIKIQWIDDYRFVISGRLDQHRVPRPGKRPLLTFLVGRALFLSWAFAVPMLFHPVATVLFFYVAGALVLGVTLVLVFMIPHLVAESEFPIPREDTGTMEKPWAVHQALVTVNFSRGNRILTWMLGGLNYHKEHHLFPLISHANYPAMSAVVEQTCRDFGLPYKCHPSFAAGIAAHYHWLKRMGCAD